MNKGAPHHILHHKYPKKNYYIDLNQLTITALFLKYLNILSNTANK